MYTYDRRVAYSTKAEATFKKLRDGSWGLLVNTSNIEPGDRVMTVTKDGRRTVKIVGKIVWSGNGIAITTMGSEERQERPESRRPVDDNPPSPSTEGNDWMSWR